jgi:hypothetical protein
VLDSESNLKISALILTPTGIEADLTSVLHFKRLQMPAETLHFDINVRQYIPHIHLSGAFCCPRPVDAHAQHYRIYDHPMLVPQLKVSHQHSTELIQPISVLISAQLKWKAVPVSEVCF